MARSARYTGSARQRVYALATKAGISRNPRKARHDWLASRQARRVDRILQAEGRLIDAIYIDGPTDAERLAAIARLDRLIRELTSILEPGVPA